LSLPRAPNPFHAMTAIVAAGRVRVLSSMGRISDTHAGDLCPPSPFPVLGCETALRVVPRFPSGGDTHCAPTPPSSTGEVCASKLLRNNLQGGLERYQSTER